MTVEQNISEKMLLKKAGNFMSIELVKNWLLNKHVAQEVDERWAELRLGDRRYLKASRPVQMHQTWGLKAAPGDRVETS